MGDCFLMRSGGGGADSADCTALRSMVLSGYTAVTADSGDAAEAGTMANYAGTSSVATPSLNTDAPGYVRLNIPARGLYDTNSRLYTTYGTMANLIGLTASKLMPGNTVLGVASSNTNLAGRTITPTKAKQTIASKGKVMTGDIVVNPIPDGWVNVAGEWLVFNYGNCAEGFAWLPKLCGYKYDSFHDGGYDSDDQYYPAQRYEDQDLIRTGVDTYFVNGFPSADNRLNNNLAWNVFGTNRYPTGGLIMLDRAIDMSLFDKLKINWRAAKGSTGSVMCYVYLCPVNKKDVGITLLDSVAGIVGADRERVFDVSSVSGQYYVAVSMGFRNVSTAGAYEIRLNSLSLTHKGVENENS